jgi:hypothetical protein
MTANYGGPIGTFAVSDSDTQANIFLAMRTARGA